LGATRSKYQCQHDCGRGCRARPSDGATRAVPRHPYRSPQTPHRQCDRVPAPTNAMPDSIS
jgi:hypothetical protein